MHRARRRLAVVRVDQQPRELVDDARLERRVAEGDRVERLRHRRLDRQRRDPLRRRLDDAAGRAAASRASRSACRRAASARSPRAPPLLLESGRARAVAEGGACSRAKFARRRRHRGARRVAALHSSASSQPRRRLLRMSMAAHGLSWGSLLSYIEPPGPPKLRARRGPPLRPPPPPTANTHLSNTNASCPHRLGLAFRRQASASPPRAAALRPSASAPQLPRFSPAARRRLRRATPRVARRRAERGGGALEAPPPELEEPPTPAEPPTPRAPPPPPPRLDDDAVVALLAALPLFRDVGGAVLRRLRALVHAQEAPRFTVIYREGLLAARGSTWWRAASCD